MVYDIRQWSGTDSSNNGAAPNGWATGTMLPSGVEPTGRMMMGAAARVYNDLYAPITTGGTTTAYTVTIAQQPASVASPLAFSVKWNATCGATPTLAVNGGTAKSIYWPDGTQATTGDLVINTYATLFYDGTNYVIRSLTGKPVSLATAALLAAANTFTASPQTVAVSGAIATARLDRTDTHGDNVLVASYYGRGRDSGGATQDYGAINIRAVLDNAGAETGGIEFQTGDAGTVTTRLHIRTGIYTNNATGGDQGADTINASALYDDGVQVTAQTLATQQATTSGTSIDFTSIPSWAKRITIMFVGVSTNGTDNWLIQIGDSGGIETSGYLGASSLGGAFSGHTDGFGMRFGNAATVAHGAVTLTMENAAAFTWVASGNVARSDTADLCATAGSKSLSAALDRVRITTTGGTNTFDAGAINILYS